MIFLISLSNSNSISPQDPKNFTIFYPLFIINQGPPSYHLLTFDIILHFLSLYYVIKCAYVSWKIREFHRNMTILIFGYSIQWFQILAANAIIKPYEYGFLSLSSLSLIDKDNEEQELEQKSIINWWTDQEDQMIKISIDQLETDFFSFSSFFIAGFVKWYYLGAVGNVLVALSIERTFACHFLEDYEKKSRKLLVFGIIIGQQGFGLLLAVIFYFNLVNYYLMFVIYVMPNGVAVGLLLYNRRCNLRIARTQEMFSTSYTLPARFQARENIKCFKMIKNAVIMAYIVLIMDTIVNFMVFSGKFRSIEQLLNFVMQCFMNVCPIFVCSTLINSVKSWRNYSCALSCHTLKRRFKNRKKQNNTVAQSDTDVYFEQLKASWN